MKLLAKSPLLGLALLSLLLFSTGARASVSPKLMQKIRDAAARASVDPWLVVAITEQESAGDPSRRSEKGAMGLMQVMPKTAEECGIRSAYHPLDNLMGACDCLRRLINRYQGNLKLALAAYNAGPGNVERYHGVPPFRETRSYVRTVLRRYARLRKEASAD